MLNRTLASTRGINCIPAIHREKVAVLNIARTIRGDFRFGSTYSEWPVNLAMMSEPTIKKIPLDRRRSKRLIPRDARPYFDRI